MKSQKCKGPQEAKLTRQPHRWLEENQREQIPRFDPSPPTFTPSSQTIQTQRKKFMECSEILHNVCQGVRGWSQTLFSGASDSTRSNGHELKYKFHLGLGDLQRSSNPNILWSPQCPTTPAQTYSPRFPPNPTSLPALPNLPKNSQCGSALGWHFVCVCFCSFSWDCQVLFFNLHQTWWPHTHHSTRNKEK